MNKFYLVKFCMDWSDEFDVCGVSVCDSVRYEHEKEVAAENSDFVFAEVSFGTNESFYELSIEELFAAYEFIEISESTYKELVPSLTDTYISGWGTWFQWPSELLADHKEYMQDE